MPASDIAASLSNLAADQQKLADMAKSLAAQAGQAMGATGDGGGGHGFFITGLTVFVLACFVGYYVVWRVTPALHSPLMAVTNAISSVIIVGALLAAGPIEMTSSKWMGLCAVVLASVNIFGGFIVTQRMLAMYKQKSEIRGQKTEDRKK
jgi:NAD(P) transhydrogenase subunit alpha